MAGRELGSYVLDALNTMLRDEMGDNYSSKYAFRSTKKFDEATFETMLLRNLSPAQKKKVDDFIKWVKKKKGITGNITSTQESWSEITLHYTQE